MEPYPSLKIIVADDHPIFRVGFKHLLERQASIANITVLEATTGLELVQQANQNYPDIIFTDIAMPVMDGIEATHLIMSKYPDAKVIAMSALDDLSTTIRMYRAGALGFISKYATTQKVIESIIAVMNGSTFVDDAIVEKLFKSKHSRAKEIELTKQELLVIKHVCAELSNKEIAHEMKLKTRTIEDYKSRLQEKLDAKNSVGIALYALLNNIVSIEELRKEKKNSPIVKLKHEKILSKLWLAKHQIIHFLIVAFLLVT
jgi:two-component system, NarL family, invasion response regulator UvrY